MSSLRAWREDIIALAIHRTTNSRSAAQEYQTREEVLFVYLYFHIALVVKYTTSCLLAAICIPIY